MPRDRILFDRGFAFSTVGSSGFTTGSPVGNGGNVEINTNSLEVRNGASLQASTFGRGNAGDVIITGDRVLFDNGNAFSTVGSSGFTTGSPVGNGGNVEINTNSLEVRNGASLQASTFGRGNAGDVIITGDRILFDNGLAFSTVGTVGFTGSPVGNGGNVEINTNSLEVRNGGQLQASTFGRGNAGDVIITGDRVLFDNGNAFSTVEPVTSEDIVRQGGDVLITAGSLDVLNGASLQASTFGRGNAGNVIITGDRVLFDNGDAFSTVEPVTSEDIVRQGGDVLITARSLDVLNGAQLQASTFGRGNAGNVIITGDRVLFNNGTAFSTVEPVTSEDIVRQGGDVLITARSLDVLNGAQLQASTFGRGNAGNVIITGDRVLFDNGTAFSTVGDSSLASSPVGNGGNVEINTNSLEVRNGGQLQAATFGRGNAGNVIITGDRVLFDNGNAFSTVEPVRVEDTVRQGGDISITAGSLNVIHGSQLQAATFGRGNAGNVIITGDRVLFDGIGADGLPSAAFSTVGTVDFKGSSVGNGGNVEINTNSLEVRNGAQLQASTFGRGNAGNVIIIGDRVLFDNGTAFSTVEPVKPEDTVRQGGDVRITTGSLDVINGGQLQASTFGRGNAGDVSIHAGDRVLFDGVGADGLPSAAFSRVEAGAIGRGGNINIDTNSLVVRNGASLTASTFAQNNTDIVNAETALRGGNVTINASTFEVTNGGRVSTTTNGDGRAGNITLDVTDRITLSGSDRQRTSGLFANTRGNSSGRGGTIRITTGQLEISDRAGVVTNSRGSGVAGNIDITAQSLQLDRGNITAGTRQNRVDGGNIRLQDVDLLQLRNRSSISTNAGGNGGDISFNAGFIVAAPTENSDISANATIGGDGGNVNITSEGLFGIERRDLSTNLSDITATSEQGVQGDININTPNVDPSRGLVQLSIDPLDASDQIARNCPISGDVAGERGEFIVTGRGGVPSNPAEILGGETLLTDLAEIEGEGQGSRTTGETSDRTAVSPRAKAEIIEAQGWVVGADGKVRLTTDNPVEPHRPPIAPVSCPSS